MAMEQGKEDRTRHQSIVATLQSTHHDTRIGRPFGLPILDYMCKFRLVELVN